MLLRLSFCILALLQFCSASLLAELRAKHIFIISFDGGKPQVMRDSDMPVLKKLADEGAVSWTAQTIFPPKTLPAHTSMLTGLGPEKHKVLWNDFSALLGKVKVPTIFTLARQKYPTLGTAMFPGKVKFRHLWQKDSLDVFDFNGPQEDIPIANTPEIETQIVPSQVAARNASAYIIAKKPNLCFIHFPDPDSAGHKSGWGSPEQKEAFKVSDQALGQVIKTINQAGIISESVILITADHGGRDKTHSENIPEDMTIPWIAWGKGVKKNFAITQPVTTCDTAATVLWLLDVPHPPNLDGKPVTEAFAKQ